MKQGSQLVTDGRVFCPQRGTDVDLERCFVCRRLVDLELDSTYPHVQCETPFALREPVTLAQSRQQGHRDFRPLEHRG